MHLTRLGWSIAVPVLLLCAVGLACIRATDRTAAREAAAASEAANPAAPLVERNWAQDAYAMIGPLTIKQLMFLATGLGLMGLTMLPHYDRIGKYSYWVYWLIIGLLALLVLDRYIDIPDAIVRVRRNTRRWITLGGAFGIQPSELMKPALILALARYLRYRDSYRRWVGLIPPFLFTLLPMLLILKQPDLGTLLMLLPVLFIMLFVAGARIRHLATIVLLGIATVPAFYFLGMKDYQKERIMVVFRQNSDDEHWHMGKGYQLRQSKIALATGGIWGQGYGQGPFLETRSPLLPEEHNDFIFAIIGHQFGLAGCLLLILMYGIIVVCGIEIATLTNDPFGRLLAIGVIVMIVMQALLNICMTIGLAPITGMTLPFVSAGGSSLWANFIALGLLLNVAKRRPLLIAKTPFEHDD